MPAYDAGRARLEALETQLLERERELAPLITTLHELQTRYLLDVGPLYAELTQLETAIEEAEIRAGLRAEPVADPDEAEAGEAAGPQDPLTSASCSNRAAPSDGLKKMFRELAKTIHPDLALDEPARCRRHSLMAEANRAYAERDEDRLRLILRAWERSPEAVIGDDAEADQQRVLRRCGEIEARLIAIDADIAELRASAIARLKQRIDDARSQGWDLFEEMVLQVKREIRRAKARLAKLSIVPPAARASL